MPQSKRTEGKKGGQNLEAQEKAATRLESEEKSLSFTAMKVVELCASPEYYQATPRQIAAAAGCSASHVRNLRSDPKWQAAFYALISRRIQKYVPELIDKAMESARLPGKDGHPDRKMLLNMAGITTAAVQRHEHQHQHSASDRLQRALERSRQRGEKILDGYQAAAQDAETVDDDGSQDRPSHEPDEADPLDPGAY
jgi:hypothetical protein